MNLRSLLCAGLLSFSGAAFAVEPVTPAAKAPAPAKTETAAPTKTELTWWGHAAFELRTPGGAVILVDPWLKNPKAPKDAVPPSSVDAILVTHGHMDHVGEAAELAKKTGATVYASFELIGLIGAQKSQPLNPGATFKVKDVTIHVVSAVHSSGFGGMEEKEHKYAGAPVGFVLAVDKGPTLYHAGDTGEFQDMALIAERFHPTYALLPVGGVFTMDPAGAAVAAKLLKVKTVIPMHFGTFPALTGTPAELTEALKKGKVSAKVQEMTPGAATVIQ